MLVDLGWSRSGAQKHWWGNPKGDGVAIPGRGIRVDDFARFVREEVRGGEWEGRVRVVGLDGRCESLFCFCFTLCPLGLRRRSGSDELE